MDPREEKLPKWAQSELSMLRRRNAEMQRALEERTVRSRHSSTAVWSDPHSDNPIPVAGVNDPVILTLTPETYHQRIDVRFIEQGVIEVMGGGSLIVRPHITNVIRVEVCK